MQYAAYNTKDVTVVILDSASTPEIYEMPEFAHTVTVKGGTLYTTTRFIMNGPMAFEDICFSDSGNPFIVAQEHKIVMGEGITVSGGGIYLVGDIDGDGNVTIKDALDLIRVILNDETIANGDVNGDGKVGLADVVRVMKLIAQ